MARLALATCGRLPALDESDRLLVEPLATHGVEATPVVWDDPQADWSDYDLVVLRSTWDYAPRRPEFLTWAASLPNLFNPYPVIEWNTDKRYLGDLHGAGVPVVRTRWVAPGEPYDLPDASADLLGPADEYVLKPTVSAGSLDTGRYRCGQPEHRELATEHVKRIHARGGTVMMQPYLTAVDAFGETAMLYLGGRFSHAIRKGPMLDGPDQGVDDLFRRERITPRTPSELEHTVAELALAAIPGSTELPYARVDLIPGADGSPIVLEVELTEPSLFLDHDDRAADRFAEVLAGHCRPD